MCGLPVSPHLKKPFVLTVYQAPLGKSHFLLSVHHKKEDRESLWKPALAACVSLRKWEAKTEAVPPFWTGRIVPSFYTDWFRSCKGITERLSFLVYLKPFLWDKRVELRQYLPRSVTSCWNRVVLLCIILFLQSVYFDTNFKINIIYSRERHSPVGVVRESEIKTPCSLSWQVHK